MDDCLIRLKESDIWEYAHNCSMEERYIIFSGGFKNKFEKKFNVRVERWAYTKLMDIPDNALSMAYTDKFTNTSYLAVIFPNNG